MNGSIGIIDYFLNHRNKIFWTFFILLGGFIIFGVLGSIYYIDVIIGLSAIAIGVMKLGEELSSRDLRAEQERIAEDINDISNWLAQNHTFVKKIKDKQDYRFMQFDKKRAELENRFEKQYRDIARKIIEVENRLNKNSKTLVNKDDFARIIAKLQASILSVSRRQFNALSLARMRGGITLSEYRKANRVTPSRAKTEINDLIEKKLLKKYGRGRTAKYVLAF